MNRRMNCRHAEPHLATLAFDELDAATRTEVEAHLAGCPACAALLRDFRATRQLLATGLTAGDAPTLSQERRADLLRQAAAAPVAPASSPTPAPILGFPARYWRPLLATAAVLLILVGIGGVLAPAFLSERAAPGCAEAPLLDLGYAARTEAAPTDEVAATGLESAGAVVVQAEPAEDGARTDGSARLPQSQSLYSDYREADATLAKHAKDVFGGAPAIQGGAAAATPTRAWGRPMPVGKPAPKPPPPASMPGGTATAGGALAVGPGMPGGMGGSGMAGGMGGAGGGGAMAPGGMMPGAPADGAVHLGSAVVQTGDRVDLFAAGKPVAGPATSVRGLTVKPAPDSGAAHDSTVAPGTGAPGAPGRAGGAYVTAGSAAPADSSPADRKSVDEVRHRIQDVGTDKLAEGLDVDTAAKSKELAVVVERRRTAGPPRPTAPPPARPAFELSAKMEHADQNGPAGGLAPTTATTASAEQEPPALAAPQPPAAPAPAPANPEPTRPEPPRPVVIGQAVTRGNAVALPGAVAGRPLSELSRVEETKSRSATAVGVERKAQPDTADWYLRDADGLARAESRKKDAGGNPVQAVPMLGDAPVLGTLFIRAEQPAAVVERLSELQQQNRSPRQEAAERLLGRTPGSDRPQTAAGWSDADADDKADGKPAFVRLTPEQAQQADQATAAVRLQFDSGTATTNFGIAAPQVAEPEKALETEQVRAVAETAAPEAPTAPIFRALPVNPWVLAARDRLSTFSLDVDTASYSVARNYLRQGQLPPPASVRMEEYLNAFDYNYRRQAGGMFNVHAEGAPSPFGEHLVLLKVGVAAKVLGREGRKPAHLVFVVDSSGSMAKPNRMPLVQQALGLLSEQLGPQDRVSLVTFGTGARLVLEGVAASDRETIRKALADIPCSGSTNLLQGVAVGYELAQREFHPGQINRVILCSDGVANVGPTEAEDILAQVGRFRDQGITFTSVGFGSGGYDDVLLEKLANRGDGNYVFVDSPEEARRVFVDQLSATLQTVAKDAKIQVEFNPVSVRRYRLIGYENRDIADKDFRNDAVDAGEVGSGQSSTALYELELFEMPQADRRGPDLGTVFVRYRDLDTNAVEEISSRLSEDAVQVRTPHTSPRFFLAACAAEFAEVLRHSEHAADGDLGRVAGLLGQVTAQLPLDRQAAELLELVQTAQRLTPQPARADR